jgi:predicted ATPase
MEKNWWEQLELKRCGPVKKSILKLGKVNLFIGPNGSGKTITAKLYNIAILEKSIDTIFAVILENLTTGSFGIEKFKKKWRNKFARWLNLPSDWEKWEFHYSLKEKNKKELVFKNK